MVTIRPKPAGMVIYYELSGASAGQRSEISDEHGRVAVDLCKDGDDKRNFIKNDGELYILYRWQRLDEVDIIRFIFCVVDKFYLVNSNEFALVSKERGSSHIHYKIDSIVKERIAINMGMSGNGALSLSSVILQREIEAW